MRLTIVGLAALALSGCASVTAVNDKGGVVEHVGQAGTGLKLADAYCAKSGKTAKATDFSVWASTLTFECIAK